MSEDEKLRAVREQVRALAVQELLELDAIERDLPTFAREQLVIRPKKGGKTTLALNAVQLAVHRQAEEQLERKGKVRKVVVKARQIGISTYIQSRLYWQSSRRAGQQAYIMAHNGDATSNLYEMSRGFQEHDRRAPAIKRSNARELLFAGLDSSIRVATAGASGIGRSQTVQFLHGSEVAFWPDAERHATGILQAVPDAPGTEIWLESTANGMAGYFYNMAQAASRGDSEFELIFIPWFDHDEYTSEPPQGWRPPRALLEYQLEYGLMLNQIRWAWRKNAELAASAGLAPDEICWKFRQEYPATADEAFRASRTGSFIAAELVHRARECKVFGSGDEPLVIGCDFACGSESEGGDMNAFIDRRGRRLGGTVYERFREGDTVQVANRLARLIERHSPDMLFLDTGGGGAGVYDILQDRGFGQFLTLINFGQGADDVRRYANKRAEMWGRLRDWLNDPGGAQIPDEDVLASELTSVTAREDLNQRLKLGSKDDIRREFGFSPDGGDAAALTFAEVVRNDPPVSGRATFAPALHERAGY